MKAKEQFKQIVDKFDNLKLRDQLLVILVWFAALFLIWKLFLLDPLLAGAQGMEAKESTLQKQIRSLRDSVQQLSQISGPETEMRREIDAINKEMAELDRQIGSFTQNLISPTQMSEALRSLLQGTPNLTLKSISSGGSLPLIRAPTPAETALTGDIQLYKHSLSLEFEGTYFSTLEYLIRLERMPYQLLWEELQYDVEKHPNAKVTIKVHTLSDNAAWIGV